jgi:hypothetical protein
MHLHGQTLAQVAGPSARHGLNANTALCASARGDFAAGLRTNAVAGDAHGTFATGIAQTSGPMAVRAGDYASGARSDASSPTIGDFAAGMRARDLGARRPHAAGRSRVDLEPARARGVAV